MVKHVSIFLLFCLFSVVALAEVKIGYIDLQRAIQSTESGKDAKKSLEKIFEKRKKEVTKVEEDLKKMGEDIEKKKSILEPSVLDERRAEMQNEMLKYQELVKKSQQEMATRERELTQPILQKMEQALDEVAKEEKLTMVFERGQNGVVWAQKELDLTDKVVAKFNALKDKKVGKSKK